MTTSNISFPVLKPQSVQLLTEIGFLACGAGNTDAASRIFNGLRVCKGERQFALIGLAMSHLESGAPEAAATLLRVNFKYIAPEDHEYRAFFAACLIASGRRNEAEKILQDLLARSAATCAAHRLGAALVKNYLTDSRVILSPRDTVKNRVAKSVL
jgi:hypothetical protein